MNNIYIHYLSTIKHYANIGIINLHEALKLEFLEAKFRANDVCVPVNRSMLLTAISTIMAILTFAQSSHFIFFLQHREALPV